MRVFGPAFVLILLLSACTSVPGEMFSVVPTPDPNLTYQSYRQSPNEYFRMTGEDREILSLLSANQMNNDVLLRVWASSAIRRDGAIEIVKTSPASVSEGFLMAVYMEFFLQLRQVCAGSAESVAAMISESVEEVSGFGNVDLPVLATTQSLALYYQVHSDQSGAALSCWDYTDGFDYQRSMMSWCFSHTVCVN